MKNFFNKKGAGSGDGKFGGKGGYKGGGGKSFGGARSGGNWKRGGNTGSDDRPALHPATCNKCGASCEVPFKPNGKKPIYCRDCFRKEEGHASAPSYDRPSYDRPAAYEKPAYRSTPRDTPSSDDVARQLKLLNSKMDAILKALTDLGEEATDEESEDGEEEET